MKFLFLLLPLLLLALVTFAEEDEKKLSMPTREVSIIVTKEGYYPKSISVFEGEKIKFFVTSTVEGPGCMIVEGHKVFMAANMGKITEGEMVFDRPGDFSFYCPGSKNDGKIVVIKKVVPKRKIASESVWMPKDH